VELMKGSLNTFLNAFTYPDRTCYPVASCNLQVRGCLVSRRALANTPACVPLARLCAPPGPSASAHGVHAPDSSALHSSRSAADLVTLYNCTLSMARCSGVGVVKSAWSLLEYGDM